MKNNYSEDIVPPSRKKSIRDIPVPSRKKVGGVEAPVKEASVIAEPVMSDVVSPTMNDVTAPPKAPGMPMPDIGGDDNDDIQVNNYPEIKSKKPILISIAVVVVIVIIFFILSSLDSADVEISPKTAEASVDKALWIENISSKVSPLSLGYRIIELSQEAEKRVPATDEEYVQQNASGIITIYNSYSSNPQKLIKNTRFEAPSGKIYRIHESVSVPGYTEDGGTETPGSVDVEVFADAAGDEYNVSSAKFTIPGFKGQDPYEFFSAETKTAISNGFDGVRKIISQESIEAAKIELSSTLTSKLIDEINEQVTEEFITVYDADSFSFNEVKQLDVEGSDEVRLTRRGTVSALVFDRVELSNALALETLAEYREDQDVLVTGLEALEINISVHDPDSKIEGDERERMDVSGNSLFVWQNDEVAIKESLAGTKKKDLGATLQNFPGIFRADAIIKPFWLGKFPATMEDIDIVVVE